MRDRVCLRSKYKCVPETEAASVELRKSQYGGTDIYINGEKVPAVIDFRCCMQHPFPSIRLEILMDQLTWEEGTLPNGLDDVQNDGNRGDDGEGDVHTGFPWNWLPAKIKAFFCKDRTLF